MTFSLSALLQRLDSVYPRLTDSALAWGKCLDMFENSLGLRFLWAMAAGNNTGQIFDASGNVRTLTRNGNPVQNMRGLVSYIDLDGTGDFYSRASEAGLAILGNEAFMHSSLRGCTVGGWFSFDRLSAAEGMIAKGDMTIANTDYILSHRGDVANDPVRFTISDGVALYTVDYNSVSLTDWHFCVGRFVPSTSMDIYVDLGKQSNLAGITAGPLVNSTSALNIGAINSGSELDGRATLTFACAAALPDAYIRALYYHSRALFGR